MRAAPRVALVAAVLACGPAAVSQAPPAPVFGTDVSLVLLPVFVSDARGRAVRGLQASDFVVEDDGQRAEVVLFRYVDTSEPVTGSDEHEGAPALTSAARRRFLLLFDKTFTTVAGLTRAQKAAHEFVTRRLADTDLAAVATFDVFRGLRLVANFTEDRALLAHAITTLGVPQLSRIADPLGLALDLQATDIATAGRSRETETPQALIDSVTALVARQMRAADREQYRGHLDTLATGLEDLARGLRHVEGRKQVLYFSAGFDSELLVGARDFSATNSSEAIASGALFEVDGQARHGDPRTRQRFADVTRALSAADTVLHSVDVTGLAADTELASMQPSALRVREGAGRESLNLLASDTGGRLFKDANDLGAALDEMLELTSRYYVLGIQPRDAKAPGEFHKLKVKVERRGVRLSHRPGFHERAPAAARPALQRQFEAAQLLMTGAGDAQMPFASLCLPFPETAEQQTLGLVVQVPRESLRWEAGKPEALELYAYAVDPEGRVRDHMAQLVRLEPGDAEARGAARGVSFFGKLQVKPGAYTLHVMVHERDSGRSGFQFLDVAVPPRDARTGFLLPPVLVEDPGAWVSVEVGRAGSPFDIDGQKFLPRASGTVRNGAAEKMVLMAWEPGAAGDPAADLQIWASLVDGDGQRRAPGAVRVEKVLHEADGRRTYVLAYEPQVAEAGDYTLRVSVGEARSILESYARLKVVN